MSISSAAGIGMALIGGEHFFSTFLSSPWTVGKFVETEEDRKQIRQYYLMACVCSLIVAGVLGSILKEKYPVIATIILCIVYVVIYERAMKEKLG